MKYLCWSHKYRTQVNLNQTKSLIFLRRSLHYFEWQLSFNEIMWRFPRICIYNFKLKLYERMHKNMTSSYYVYVLTTLYIFNRQLKYQVSTRKWNSNIPTNTDSASRLIRCYKFPVLCWILGRKKQSSYRFDSHVPNAGLVNLNRCNFSLVALIGTNPLQVTTRHNAVRVLPRT